MHDLQEYYMYTMDYVNNHKLAKVSYAVVYGKQLGMTLMFAWVITAVKRYMYDTAIDKNSLKNLLSYNKIIIA